MSQISFFILLLFGVLSTSAQSVDNVILKGDYDAIDSIQIVEAYREAKDAVNLMYEAMNDIYLSKDFVRRWQEEEGFVKWLGQPDKVRLVNRNIRKIKSKFDKKIIFNVTRQKKGRCSGWISAWTIPFGKIRVTLCEDFFIYRTHLQEKTLIHEMGHEIGILFHRKIHGCRAARRAVSFNDNVAKRSTENYAWLAMSYKGLECNH
ncbi:MAG: hypothetical protein ABJG78_02205 [Cyclobacteriaceae bacterium]